MEKDVLDLSKKCLKRLPRQEDAQTFRVLILDDNELQKIDNVDSFSQIENLSISKNQLLRMYGVCRLRSIKDLNLSFNSILTIEGLKELIHLTHLSLAGNKIQTIEHLNTNIKLEYLDLSNNCIGSISDISFLKCLKNLHLHGNRLTHLKQCEKYLPLSIETLALSKNSINDLNEICSLVNLSNLQNLSISENPCVQTIGSDGFDHRPFVLNWCMSLKIIDGLAVDPIESLKAEWLYSQGRGRQFRVGEQASLAKYLSSVCPLLGEVLENDNERKLRLILSKAQQHQRQLQEEISEGANTTECISLIGKGKKSSQCQSPRLFSRGGQGSLDKMSNSYHGNTFYNFLTSDSKETSTGSNASQMTTSLVDNIRSELVPASRVCDQLNPLARNINKSDSYAQDTSLQSKYASLHNDAINFSFDCPLIAASKMVPVPETLMSPDICPIPTSHQASLSTLSLIIDQHLGNNSANKNLKEKDSPKLNCIAHLRRDNGNISVLSSGKVINEPSHCHELNSSLFDSNEVYSTQFQEHIRIVSPNESRTVSSDEDSDCVNIDKLETIRSKAAQRSRQRKNKCVTCPKKITCAESSAVVIQKNWRGYCARKKNKDLMEKLMKNRIQEYINKLSKEMELTKAQLENERKIQQLQMQAINALWKKVSTMQTVPIPRTSLAETHDSSSSSRNIQLDNSSTSIVEDLTKTCSLLINQVQQLQGSMRDIVSYMTLLCGLSQESLFKVLNKCERKDTLGTQTELTAVHTPQFENLAHFPFKIRPSSLTLEQNSDLYGKVDSAVSRNKDEVLYEETLVGNLDVTS